MSINKICPICNKDFKLKLSHYNKRITCSLKCMGLWQSINCIGEKSRNWKGGKEKHSSGYIWIYQPNHPYAHKGKVAEHRLIMEKYLGRLLTDNEIVHHINGDKTDNKIENLKLMTNSEHSKMHKLGKPTRRGWKHTEEWKEKMSILRKGKHLKEIIIKNCLVCKKEMNLFPSFKEKKYCSKRCMYNRNKVTFDVNKEIKN